MNIEKIKSLFQDPSRVSDGELGRLAADSIRAMEEIYATGGRLDLMTPEIRSWLQRSAGISTNRSLSGVLGEILFREASTRRFDHKFAGQIHPQGSKIGILANLIAAYMNTNTIVKEVSAAEHQMELEATSWLAEIFGYDPKEASGNIVSGGTTANLAALWAARQAKIKQWRDSRNENPKHKLLVLANSLRHYSIDKSCEILGMSLVRLPVKDFKTDTQKLETIIRNLPNEKRDRIAAIVGVAGETETGLVDDLNALSDLRDRFGLYLHVDAAYGGPFILSRAKGLFAGIERADSITVDPHKLLYTPYPAGAILFRDRRFHALIQKKARYLQPEGNKGLLGDTNDRNFGFAARVEGSMGAAGVISTWASIRLFGRPGFQALLDHTIDLTEFAYDRVSNSQLLRPLFKPETNSLLIGLADRDHFSANFHNSVVEIAQARTDQNGLYISTNSEIDEGRSAFRFVAVHPFTTQELVDRLITSLENEIAHYLEENEPL